ncbi:MAG: right-handed parallel beta-helix repeat-containing protein, partial [Treponema sp.]|nr:right-handed parallel beta-helix repeat-containing protein [Treponema sp.]
MKKTTFLRKLNFLVALGGVFAAAAFYGCGNLFSSIDSASDSPANLAQPREGYGIVSGSLPSSDSASARTAMPSKPDETALSFKVFAQSGAQRIEANVNDTDRTFSLSLPFGTWEITANGMLADGRILFTQTQTVTLSEENATAFLRFELGYSTNPDDGDGEISLSVSFPPKSDTSAIRGIEYVLSKGEEKIVQNVSDAELGAGKFKIGLATENLGAWHLTILFYGDFSNLVYRIDQTVNVYANLTTDTFEGSAPYISGGAIAVTQALLEDFQNTTLYVNATSGKDTNTGTQFDPLQTFNRALELVNNSTRDASTEFRIFLQTDVADGATLKLDGGKKLTVASASADGTTRTITSLGRTFTVSSTSELTVQSVACKKLRFDVSGTFTMDGGEISGNTADNGGAICINAGGKATIANTKIHDNTASNKGGGVYVGGSAKATLTNCAIESCKTTSTTSRDGGGGIYSLGTLTVTGGTISDCIAGRSGGGIYAYGGTAECSDGVAFSNCEATGSGNVGSGGGICINKDVTVDVSDCTFVSCSANASGGGIWNAGELTVRNTSFTTCSANNNGGGVCNDGGKVTMSGTAKITGNNASDGGGVAVNSGTFTLENGTISNNTADNGGGVYTKNGTVTMTGGTISENTANGDGGGVSLNDGSFKLEDGGTISRNKAVYGAGIHVNGGSKVTMTGGTVSGNTADGGNKSGGGGIHLYDGTFEMSGGEISGNTADGTAEDSGGGGMYIYQRNTNTFTMTGGSFSKNTAQRGKGAFVCKKDGSTGTLSMSGSAKFAESDDVYLYDAAPNTEPAPTITVADTLTAESLVATITPSTYDLDRQVLSAGGVPIDSDVCAQFALTPNPDEPDAEWNIMPDSTGANGVLKTKIDVYVRGNNATWYESNEPTASAGSDDNAGTPRAPLATIQAAIEKVLEQNDGADAYTIFVDGTLDGTTAAKLGDNGMADFSKLTKNLTLTIEALSETAKATLDGGARFDASGNATNEGIGKRIINAKPASGALNLTLENLVITGGSTTANGGGIYIEGGNATLTMNGCTISGNTAGAKGGGIYNNGGTVKMKGCTITDCKAGGTSNDEGGGGIYNASGTLELTGVTITLDSDGTRAAYQGGGIFNAGTLTMTGGSITGGGRLSGSLYYHGGGIYNTGVLTIEGVTISNFYTGGYGGGIYNNNGETAADFVTIKDCIITDCGSGQVGSGICTYKGKLKLENVDIIGGTANTSTGIYCYMSKLTIIGGKIEGFKKAAILTSSSSELKMDGTTVSGNTSTYSCGGVEVDCPFEIKNCTITGNEAKAWSNIQNGGGLYIGNCTGTITNTTISGNTAGGDGGGVYIFGTADVTITDCIIKDNTATTGGGGGIYIDDSTATLKM